MCIIIQFQVWKTQNPKKFVKKPTNSLKTGVELAFLHAIMASAHASYLQELSLAFSCTLPLMRATMLSICQYQCGELSTHTFLDANKRRIENNCIVFFCHFRIRFPYDWRNPSGYLVAISIQYFLAFYPSRYVGCFLCFAFGAFMFSMATVEILKNELHAIDMMGSGRKTREKMLKSFSEFIRRHADAKQLSEWPISHIKIILKLLFLL